jgi:copper(I)-binding protein
VRPPPAFIAVAGGVVALGLAGLILGAVPQPAAGGPDTLATASAPIVITDAYVREPASPDVAAAYFTATNTTGTDDTLVAVATGAGQIATLHDASMSAMAGGLRVPAHSSVTLSPAHGHVMIERLVGPLRPGQTVNLQLTFERAGPLVIEAPVIGINAPAPGASSASASTGSGG